MAQRKILIIFTGGTIASVKSENGLIPGLNAPQILEFIPEIPADIECTGQAFLQHFVR